MATAKFQYKCRQCGEVHTDSMAHPETASSILLNLVFEFMPKPAAPGGDLTMVSVHHCIFGGKGVSDLVGYIVED